MKPILSILFLLGILIQTTAFAQGKPKAAIAVIGEEPAKGTFAMLGASLTQGFLSSGQYIAVDRSDDVSKILKKEHGYQRGGAVSDDQIVAMGKQLGVNLMCVIESKETPNDFLLTARLVGVESRAVEGMGTANSKLLTSKVIDKAATEIVAELLGTGTGKPHSAEAGGSDETVLYLQVKEPESSGEALRTAMGELLEENSVTLADGANDGSWQLKLDAGKDCSCKENKSKDDGEEYSEFYCNAKVKVELYSNDEGTNKVKTTVTGPKEGWTEKEKACENALKASVEAIWEKVDKKMK
jgi:hypothetical protein